MRRLFLALFIAWFTVGMSSPVNGHADDSSIPAGVPQSPEDFPDGWDECMQDRIKIAYVRALPWYQRVPLEPYRLVKKWQYVRCVKGLLPETEAHIEAKYPIPYDPYAELESTNSDETDLSNDPLPVMEILNDE